MDHADHVGLIREGVPGPGGRWLELGAGEGAFTLALADVLGSDGSIVALDRDRRALDRLAERLARAFPEVHLVTRVADFRDGLPRGPFDGVLAANSLHFIADPASILRGAHSVLRPGGAIVLVEYDADRGNPWVPHPFSITTADRLLRAAGFGDVRRLGRVPSRFLGAIYSIGAARPASDGD